VLKTGVANIKGLSDLNSYLKKLEDDIRETRQKLEEVERTFTMKARNGASTQSTDDLQVINSLSKELFDVIVKSRLDKSDPVESLVVPEVPEKIVRLKKVVNQLDKKRGHKSK
jgi:septal ring factor EnvC (AmiA/AmiB activator)